MSLQFTVMSLDFDSFGGPEIHTFQKPEITVGRLSTNDIVLDSPEVSQHHALVRIVDGTKNGDTKISITDLGSTNGTFVENSPIAPRSVVMMSPNERIRIGNYLIKPSYVQDGLEITEVKPRSEASDVQTGVKAENRMDSKSESKSGNGRRNNAPWGIESLIPRRSSPTRSGASAVPKRVITRDDDTDLLTTGGDEPALSKSATATAPIRSTSRMLKNIPLPPSEESADRANENFEIPVARVGSASGVVSGDISVMQIDFEAVRLCSLRGLIRHHDAPLAGVFVDAGPLGSCESKDDGSFAFSDLDEGTPYSISFTKRGYKFDAPQSSGILNEDTQLGISGIQLVAIRGTIMHQGKPLAGAEVDAGPLGKTITDVDGSYTFPDVAEGTEYSLRVSKPGFRFTA